MAFYKHFRYYECLVLPFRLNNAPNTFNEWQSFMGQFIVDFIDEVLVYSKNIIDHESHLRSIFQ